MNCHNEYYKDEYENKTFYRSNCKCAAVGNCGRTIGFFLLILTVLFWFFTWDIGVQSAIAADLVSKVPGATNIGITLSGSGLSSEIFQIMGLLTVLSLAPAILVMLTSFTRIIVVFSILRNALGLQQSPPNQVLVGLALFLTMFIMGPTFNQAYENGIKPLINKQISEEAAIDKIIEPIRKFLRNNTSDREIDMFMDMAKKVEQKAGNKLEQKIKTTKEVTKIINSSENVNTSLTATANLDGSAKKNGTRSSKLNTSKTSTPIDEKSLSFLSILVPAFMISELKVAFQIGFLLFLPFLIIDILVSSILMSVGMMMMPPVMISLPFKLIFFTMIDGWHLLCASLIQSYS